MSFFLHEKNRVMDSDGRRLMQHLIDSAKSGRGSIVLPNGDYAGIQFKYEATGTDLEGPLWSDFPKTLQEKRPPF